MKRLPRDVSRCAGRISFEPDADSICPDRETCARYTSIALDREAAPRGGGYPRSIVMDLRDADGVCRHRREG